MRKLSGERKAYLLKPSSEEVVGTLENRVLACIREHGMAQPHQPALLMVSGGSDSTALAYLAKSLHDAGELGPLSILHVNHGLRGSDADDDAAFVERLAKVLDLPVVVAAVDVGGITQSERGNVEAIARRERYTAAQQALSDLCLREGCPVSQGVIFVAHTADDRIENFYMRSIVGTGPGGFRSMLYVNGRVARPLLDCGRDELRDYIEARVETGMPVVRSGSGALWCEDATNEHTDRFRAYVRHEIVPLAKARNPRLLETLTRTMNLIADEDDMLDEMADDLIEQHVTRLEPAEEGCVLSPWIAAERLPLRRRVVVKVIEGFLGPDERIEAATVDAVLAAFSGGKPVSGYVANIQGNLAVSANRNGVRIEPMAAFRTRRKM